MHGVLLQISEILVYRNFKLSAFFVLSKLILFFWYILNSLVALHLLLEDQSLYTAYL